MMSEPAFLALDECPNCHSPRRDIVEDTETGDRVCRDCGRVLESNVISDDPEWRAFTDDTTAPDHCRVGWESAHWVGESLVTGIDTRGHVGGGRGRKNGAAADKKSATGDAGSGGGGGGGVGLGAGKMLKMHKKLTSSTAQRRLEEHIGDVTTLCARMDLPDTVQTEARVLFGKVCEQCVLLERTIPAMVAACVYAGCRLVRMPRTIKEVAQYTTATTRAIGKAFTNLKRVLGLQLVTSPLRDYVHRFCAQLKLREAIARDAISICDNCTDTLSTVHVPTAVTGATIYVACKLSDREVDRRSDVEVSRAAGVSSSALTKAVQSLGEVITTVVPADLVTRVRQQPRVAQLGLASADTAVLLMALINR